MLQLRLLTAGLALLALPLAACVTSNGGGTGGTGGSTGSDPSLCSTDPRAEAYAIGLSAKSMDGKIEVSFVDASPAPPTKGENAWTVEVTDGTGKPVTGATISLEPYMPDHGHGSSITPQIKPMPSTPGQYQVTLIDLFMPGIWQNTFTIMPPSGTAESVVFTFCVDG